MYIDKESGLTIYETFEDLLLSKLSITMEYNGDYYMKHLFQK